MKLRPITAIQSILVAILFFSCGFAFGQSPFELVAKWVLDLDKMASVHPEWQGELTPDLWIVTSYSNHELRISRGIEADEVRQADDLERYNFDHATRIPFGDSQAVVEARWEQNRVVATVAPVNGDAALTRSIYREDQWMVIEEKRSDGETFRWYFAKS